MCVTYGKLLSVLNKGRSAILSLFNGLDLLSSENVTKKSNMDDSVIYLPGFPSISNLKLHSILVTLKLIKKIKTDLDFPKPSSPG